MSAAGEVAAAACLEEVILFQKPVRWGRKLPWEKNAWDKTQFLWKQKKSKRGVGGWKRENREKEEEEDVLECFWRYVIMEGHMWNAVNLGLLCGSQCCLFINHMHGTTALIAAVRGSFHIQTTYQSICRAAMDLTCSYLCSEPYALRRNSSLRSTEAMLCCVKRQGLRFLLRSLRSRSLCLTSVHKHATKPSQTPLFKLSFITPPGCM